MFQTRNCRENQNTH